MNNDEIINFNKNFNFLIAVLFTLQIKQNKAYTFMHQEISQQKQVAQQKSQPFSLENYLNHEFINKKVTCLPLEFQYIPVDIISKQYTKLNNSHPYRIHYLGPRFKNTLEMHKKNSYSEKSPFVYNSDLFGNQICIEPKKSKQFKKSSTLMKLQVPAQQQNVRIVRAYVREHLQIGFFSTSDDQQYLNLALSEEEQKQVAQILFSSKKDESVRKYKVDMRKIAHSFLLEERLKNTQYFKSTVYYRAFQGINPSLNLNQEFIFNSCFESGNLDCVIKLQQRQFDLFLRIDSNTRGHLLWFYFSVKNQKQLGKIKMNICNFSKGKSLYNQGLKPYVFSTERFKKDCVGWQQNGINLGLQKKQLRYEVLQQKVNTKNINCLTLEYQFQHQNDEVFFAYCIPYTYSQLINDIENLPSKYVEKSYLGKSLLGTNIPILYISDHTEIQSKCKSKSQYQSTTSNINSEQQNKKQTAKGKQKKKIIFATGRIHPSQSNSSYVIMGFINWLCSEQKQAIQLRKIARFIVVPMVNPDGVIIGNSRTSASGKDLNRQYINPDPSLYPEVFLIKDIARKIHQEHEIALFLDFHGHSRKKNTFFYGPVYNISQPNYYKCRILPKMIEKISNPFRFHSCSFNIIEDKKKTARASMFQSLGIQYTYTVESSIGYFYDCEKLKIFEFSQRQWRKMGCAIAKGTALFITGIDSYEQILEQKRKQRLRKKKFYRYPNLRVDYLQDQMFLEVDNGEQPLKIPYEDKDTIQPRQSAKGSTSKSNVFLELLQQLRTNAKTPKNQTKQVDIKDLDLDEDSDSHDQKQDMQLNRLKQFKFLVKHQAKKNTVTQQKHNYQIKFNNEDQSSKSKRFFPSNKITNKIISQFQLLKQIQKLKATSPTRNAKTGDGRRNYSPQKVQIQLIEQSHREKTLPQDFIQNKDTNVANHFINNYQTPFLNLPLKRPIQSSIKRQKKDFESIQKQRQKTIGNYFGQYRMIITQNGQGEKKRQKSDLIRKLQSRRQNSRKARAQSSGQFKSNLSLRNSNHINHYSSSHKNQKIHQQIVHGPTQFTFSLPFTAEIPEASKSYILKPKLKLNLRQKPHSIQHFQNSFSVKQKGDSINIKEKSEKMIQGLMNNIQQKESSREKRSSINYLLQYKGQSGNKKNHFSEKSTGRDSNKCTKIDLNNFNNTSIFNNLKIQQI